MLDDMRWGSSLGRGHTKSDALIRKDAIMITCNDMMLMLVYPTPILINYYVFNKVQPHFNYFVFNPPKISILLKLNFYL